MPIVRSDEVKFTPGLVENSRRRVLIDADRGSGAITLGEVIMNSGAELPMHTHQVEEAMVITRGTATLVLGDETYTLNPSDVILAPASVKHTLANHGKEPMGFLFFYPALEIRFDRV
ncbi:cupin domain-containing protein [Chloroflexota bacterium]